MFNNYYVIILIMKGDKSVLSIIVGILILGTTGPLQITEAQDLPPSDYSPKKFQKMDSSLVELYELKSQGKALPVSALISTDGEKVKVVIELTDPGLGIPQNLGIEIETSYENLIQAMVPITNLQKIASDKNVKFIRLPSELGSTSQPSENELETIAQPSESELETIAQPSESELESTSQPSESENVSDDFNFIYLAIILVLVLPIIYYKIKKRRN